jgi:hypothetical protein
MESAYVFHVQVPGVLPNYKLTSAVTLPCTLGQYDALPQMLPTRPSFTKTLSSKRAGGAGKDDRGRER